MAHTVGNIEGFESQTVAGWRSYDTFSGGGVGTVGAGLQRTGLFAAFTVGLGYCQMPIRWRANGTAALNPDVTRALIARIYYRPSFFGPVNPTAVITVGRTPAIPNYPCRVEINAAFQLSLNGNFAGFPTVLMLNTYYRLELFFDSNTGDMELRIDGVTEVAINQAVLSGDFFQIGDERVTAGGGHVYDDLLIEAHPNLVSEVDWPGEGDVRRLLTTANGTDNNWALVGAPTKWQAVNDTVPDAVNYIECNNPPVGVNPDQTFVLQTTGVVVVPPPPVPVGYQVRGLKVAHYTRNGPADNPQWRYARIRSGATAAETNMTNIGTVNWNIHAAGIWQNDPDTGAPWTNPAVDVLEAGIGCDDQTDVGRSTMMLVYIEGGIPWAVGRAKINPECLGPPGPQMINAPVMGA